MAVNPGNIRFVHELSNDSAAKQLGDIVSTMKDMEKRNMQVEFFKQVME